MAPKKEKGGTVSNSSKLWEPSLIGAHFNQVSPEPRKSSLTPAAKALRDRLSPDSTVAPLRQFFIPPSQARSFLPLYDPGSHLRRMGVKGRREGTPGESVRFPRVEKAEWWGTEVV